MKSHSRLTRRAFLAKSAAAATAVGAVKSLHALPASAPASSAHLWPENGTLIPDVGWHLWVDEHAAWQSDTLFLPEDVRPGGPGDIATLPVNPPTGGWSVIEGAAPNSAPGAIPVTLPSTVEQHFWGHAFGNQPGARPYTPDEYRYAADDPIPRNGAYFGVSWWYRPISIPAEMRGKRIFLHIRGAHLRAEVYLNRKLVGYSIMEELPFEADLTHAADPGGQNLLAIRITNPFGRFDWVDGLNAQWGAVKLHRSHGFGGLDRGMTISSHAGSVRIKDSWVLNGEFVGQIYMRTVTEIISDQQPSGVLMHDIIDPVTGKIVGGSKQDKTTLLASILEHDAGIELKDVALWDVDHPRLYHLRTTWKGDDGHSDTRTIPFGFRTFAPKGLGTNALFRLNGRRTRIYTSISWGFWGLNGLFPTPELARKEVTQAKKLGLNCLNFHRNLPKEEVLRAHDQLGLLRYMEPGGGKLAIGKLPEGVAANAANIVMEKPTDPADLFAQRYMVAKCVGMVRAARSHPSVIEYCLQNEIGADLNNPDTLAVLKAMRAEDPSRSIVLNDGFVAPPRKAAQAWYEPWNDHLHRSDQEPWGGWWNQHQGAGDQWYDEFYKSPTDFTYAAPPFPGVITEYGEMEGCATPDNHSLMLHQLADPARAGLGHQPANTSYDLIDHQQIEAETARWLDRWGFRQAFPANEQLWLSIGKKCYDTWQNYLENARISDQLDFAAISGWESTAIENHSGIVDNLRNFKSDPTPISATLLPVRPVAKQRALCTALGHKAVFDLFLLNDTSQPVTGTLDFTAVTPSGKLLKLASLPAPAQQPDQFSYLLQEAFTTPALNEEGLYRFKFALSSMPLNTQTKEVWVTGAEISEECKAARVAVSGITPAFRKQLERMGCAQVSDFKPGETYAAIISAGLTTHTSATQDSGDTTGLEAQPARKLEPGEAPSTTQLGHIDPAILEAVRAGTPLLAIPQADTLSEGVAQQLAAAGAFTYSGTVGDFRAPWMGNWYFVREHPLFAGLPVNQAMGIHYAARGRQSNGLLVDSAPGGPALEIVVGYSRDHDRRIGAGTFTTKLGKGKLLFHRVPELHPVLQQRFLVNALTWLTSRG